jgi:hypothetical protein
MKTTLKVLVFVFIGIFLVQIGFVIWPVKGVLTSIIQIASSGIITLTLILTLQTYIRINEVSKETLKVSKETLEFAKIQSSFNTYFDNYKLYNELANRKIDILHEGELLFPDQIELFENLTFENIHYNFLEAVKRFPVETTDMKYRLVLKRFNSKILDFIEMLLDETYQIGTDDNLSLNQKKKLFNLYRNFVMRDYINLSKDLLNNTDLYENRIPRDIFDISHFAELFYEMDKIILEK